jgi:hypothetical protein
MWYMHDGALAHFSFALQDVNYHDRCIGRGGPTAWPQHSPDLNPLDYYLWGHLKTLVHAAPVDNEEACHHHIVDAFQAVSNYPGISEWMWRSMMGCVKMSTESYGGHFEQLL